MTNKQQPHWHEEEPHEEWPDRGLWTLAAVVIGVLIVVAVLVGLAMRG